jgi:hypothetical protein
VVTEGVHVEEGGGDELEEAGDEEKGDSSMSV